LNYKEASRNFLENEKQFHLGVIPTEQSNPRTRNLSATIQRDTLAGVKMILSADLDIAGVAKKAFKTKEFKRFVDDIKNALDNRKQVVFSSVGASGRMAITLDSAWRQFWTSLVQKLPTRAAEFVEIANLISSFTTGGDRALVRSVENFEDYMSFGRQQVVDAGIGKGDILVGLAECGLSASINGSVLEAQERGCTTYYLYCNPKEILVKHLDRVRVVFENKEIIKISLFVGNMAVSGSTRMQVTTVELLAAGAAMEVAANRWLRENLTEEELEVIGLVALELDEYAKEFAKLNKALTNDKAAKGLAQAVDYETETYKNKGLVTYVTHDYLLDLLTDTTERQPTFTLPPYKKFADKDALVSWAYVKDPLYPNTVAWQHVFRRPIKGLDWTVEDYKRLGASEAIINNPPLVASSEVEQYYIGNEDDPSRYSQPNSKLIVLDINGSANEQVMKYFFENLPKYSDGIVIRMGNIPKGKLYKNEIRIPVKLPRTSTDIMTHLLVKVAFNLISTGSMAKLGRVWGNWMIQVLPTNKKLIDRSTRIIANIANIPYEQANEEFFKSYYGRKPEEEYRESYVVETLRRLGFDPNQDRE
jgi:N-acetylmuramic acid 6-phosphate etherase